MTTTLDPASPLARLMDGPMRPGVVEWIGLRTARRGPIEVVQEAGLDPVQGLVGDRYQGGGARHVTLVEAESLAAIAAFMGLSEVRPEQLRRNVVVRGINLAALKGRRFALGSAVLESTGDCHPCSRMEEVLGPGGYNAVRGHGGITARVLEAGVVRVGDRLERLPPP